MAFGAAQFHDACLNHCLGIARTLCSVTEITEALGVVQPWSQSSSRRATFLFKCNLPGLQIKLYRKKKIIIKKIKDASAFVGWEEKRCSSFIITNDNLRKDPAYFPNILHKENNAIILACRSIKPRIAGIWSQDSIPCTSIRTWG